MLGGNVRKSLQSFVTDLVNKLRMSAPKNTGKLAQSFKGTVVGDDVKIEGASYAIFINDGINGTERNRNSMFSFTNKKPPISALKDFAKAKGINEFALQKSIFKNGIRGRHFIENPYNDSLGSLSENLTQAVWEDFREDVLSNNPIFKKQ
jgi:hypothetical protein